MVLVSSPVQGVRCVTEGSGPLTVFLICALSESPQPSDCFGSEIRSTASVNHWGGMGPSANFLGRHLSVSISTARIKTSESELPR